MKSAINISWDELESLYGAYEELKKEGLLVYNEHVSEAQFAQAMQVLENIFVQFSMVPSSAHPEGIPVPFGAVVYAINILLNSYPPTFSPFLGCGIGELDDDQQRFFERRRADYDRVVHLSNRLRESC